MGFITEFAIAMENALSDPMFIALESDNPNTRTDDANDKENNPNRESTANNQKQGEGGNANTRPESEKTESQNDALDSDQAQKGRIQKFLQAVANLFTNFLNGLDKFIQNMTNAVKKIMLSHDAFMQEYKRMKARYKPQKSVVIMNYQYDEQVMKQAADRMGRFVSDGFREVEILIQKLGGEDFIANKSFLLQSGENFELAMIKSMDPSTKATSVGNYFTEFKEKFRGEKKSYSMGIAELSNAEGILLNYKNLQKNISQKCVEIKNRIKTMNNLINRVMNQKVVTDAERKKLFLMTKNLIRLNNSCVQFLGYVDTLRTEEYYTARYIVKKFYRF